MSKKNLVAIIKANPGCHAIIDNDCWSLYKANPSTAPDDDYDNWLKANLLASGDDQLTQMAGSTYQEDNCYGGALLRALALIAGMKIESV